VDQTVSYRDLAAGRWKELPLLERMANIASEVDFFYGTNEFKSTEESLRKYFSHFTYAARRNS
jgi:hypothetical protein